MEHCERPLREDDTLEELRTIQKTKMEWGPEGGLRAKERRASTMSKDRAEEGKEKKGKKKRRRKKGRKGKKKKKGEEKKEKREKKKKNAGKKPTSNCHACSNPRVLDMSFSFTSLMLLLPSPIPSCPPF